MCLQDPRRTTYRFEGLGEGVELFDVVAHATDVVSDGWSIANA